MKPIIAFLLFFVVLGCGSDDNGDPNGGDVNIEFTFNVTITAVGIFGAQIAWSPPTGGNVGGSWVYRVALNNDVIADGLHETSFAITELDEFTEYSGTVFAINSNGVETFSTFGFTTLENTICDNGLGLHSQQAIDNNFITECNSVLIQGADITDLTPLAGTLTKINEIWIVNTSLENLTGLENINSRGGEIKIVMYFNHQLVDISALNHFFPQANIININSNENLVNFDGFEVGSALNRLSLGNLNITELPDFGNMPLREIVLYNLDITNFSGLRFTPEIGTLDVRNMPNITGFAGFDNIERLYALNLWSNPNLNNLSDLETLNASAGVDDRAGKVSVYIRNNPNLTNFCGIQEWMANTEVRIGCINPPSCTNTVTQFSVMGNAYNPTEVQIESPTDCAL